MTVFNPGTSSLKATTLETALIECVARTQLFETAAQILDPTIANSVAVDFFTGDNTAAITLNLPVQQTTGAAGQVQLIGIPYFNEPLFINTDSELKSSTWVGAIVELVALLEAAERVIGSENELQSSFDLNTARMSLNAVMPIEMMINAMGYPEFKATEYTVAAPVVIITN
jgi:hypothetical protein